MEEKYIYYLGLENRLEKSFLNIKKKERSHRISLKFIEFSNNEDLSSIFLQLLKTPPHALFLELNNLDQGFKNFILLMKSHSKLCDIRCFIVFQDKDDREQFQGIYSFGMEYGFILGEELDQVLLDVIYLSINPHVKLPQYATVKSLYLESTVSALCKVAHFTEDSVFIETHQSMDLGKIIEIDLNFIGDLKIKYAQVIKIDPFLPLSCFYHSLALKLLFKDAVELNNIKEGTDSCRKQAYLRLIDSLGDKTRLQNKTILIVDRREQTFAEVMGHLGNENYCVKIRNVLSRDPYIVTSFRPELIVFQQDSANFSKSKDPLAINGRDAFKNILSQINQTEGYRPFVFIFNEIEKSEFFRSNYRYQRIIANKKNFEAALIPTLMSYNLPSIKNKKPIYYLKTSDKTSYAQIRLKIFITMISEHTISFYHESELPLYATFKFLMYTDREFYLTVIPPTLELPQKKGMVSHMAVITNITEKEKMELRILVNYLLFLDLKELSALELKSVEKLRAEDLDSKIKQLQIERKSQRNNLADKKK